MAGKHYSEWNITLGQSWETVDLPEEDDDDELEQERAEYEERCKASNRLSTEDPEAPKPPGIPAEFMCIFGSYPMEDVFSIAHCNFCGTRIKTQCMDMHIAACPEIPDEERQILAEYEANAGSSIEPLASSGSSSMKAHRYAHVPVQKPVQLPKLSASTGVPSTSRSVQPHLHSSTSKSKPQLEKDVKPVIEKPKSPSTAAIMKSKLSSQATTVTELKPNSPSAAEFQKPKSLKNSPGELKAPNSPSSSMMPKLKPSLILKISATTPVGSPGSTEGQPQTGSKGKTYSVSHSSVGTAASESDSLPTSPSPDLTASPSPRAVLTLTPPATPAPVPTKASLKAVDNIEREAPAKKKKKKKSKNEPRKVIPLKERSFNPNEHCGVANADGSQCKRSLTCKTHSMALRRAVPSRSQPFDMLLASHKKARDEAKLAKQGEDLITVKEILHNSLKGQDRSNSPDKEVAFMTNVSDNSRSRPILTSLLANCSPTNASKSRPNGVSPRQTRETSPQKTSPESKKKNKSFKYKKEDPDAIGIDLYQLEKASGFVCFDDIIPPDDEVENCDITLDSIYDTDLRFKDSLDHDSDGDCDLLTRPLLPIEIPRKRKPQSARQLLPINKYARIPSVTEMHVSDVSTPSTLSRGPAYFRSESEYRLGGVKRNRSGSSDTSLFPSAKCSDTKPWESSHHDPGAPRSTGFHHSNLTNQGKEPDTSDFPDLNQEAPTTLWSMDCSSSTNKVSFKLHGKRVFRPANNSPIISSAFGSKVSSAHHNIAVSSARRQGEEENEDSLVLVPKVTHRTPAQKDMPEESPVKLEPMLHQRQDVSPKILETPAIARTSMQMPSLVSSQKTFIAFQNLDGTIAQVTSHNPGTVHYRGSDDMRDQQGTWASLLEQVRVGIEQGRPEDAPVADSELSKLLAAQFED